LHRSDHRNRASVSRCRFELELSDRSFGGFLEPETGPARYLNCADLAIPAEHYAGFHRCGDVGLLGFRGIVGSRSTEEFEWSKTFEARRALGRNLFGGIRIGCDYRFRRQHGGAVTLKLLNVTCTLARKLGRYGRKSGLFRIAGFCEELE
jgi:hypothetical protein